MYISDYFFLSYFTLWAIMWSKFSIAHVVNDIKCGISDSPRGVNEYSTFGGTSGYTLRDTMSSASSVLKHDERTRDDISGIFFSSALNLIGSPFW